MWDGQRRSRAQSSQGTEGRGLAPDLPPTSVRVAGGAASRLSRRFMPRPLFRVCRGPSPPVVPPCVRLLTCMGHGEQGPIPTASFNLITSSKA